MTLCINHNILVMSIFYLQNVLGKRISSQTVTEIPLSSLESLAFNLALSMMNYEIIKESSTVCSFMDFVNTYSVVNNFDQTTVRSSSKNLISFEPEIQLFNLENLVNLRNQLHRELFLSHIVKSLYYYSYQVP
jgi:hypothetical protein